MPFPTPTPTSALLTLPLRPPQLPASRDNEDARRLIAASHLVTQTLYVALDDDDPTGSADDDTATHAARARCLFTTAVDGRRARAGASAGR